MHTVDELVKVLETLAPRHLAESWDNVGLLVGSRKQTVNKVLCALDLDQSVLEEAIAHEVDCIVTHHPFLFSALKRIDLDSPKGKIIEQLIKHDIAVYSMHTNLDTVCGGINDVLCKQFGISETKILHVTKKESLVKLCVYVPEDHLEIIRETIIANNHYNIGNYTGCTFSGKGEGTFKPLEGADPYIGELGNLEKVKEVKLETIVRQNQLGQLLEQIQEVHPYEEMAYDVIALKNLIHTEGLGRYGKISPCTIKELAEKIKNQLGISAVRIVGELERTIENVAICSGSGSSFIDDAAKVAQLYITGDVKFHEAQSALEQGLSMIDIGHYASENVIVPVLTEYIASQIKGIEVISSQVKGEVFHTI